MLSNMTQDPPSGDTKPREGVSPHEVLCSNASSNILHKAQTETTLMPVDW